MRKTLLLLAFVLMTIPVRSQKFENFVFNGKMETVAYEISRLKIIDSLFLCDIDSIIMPILHEQSVKMEGKTYYYRMHFFERSTDKSVIIEQSEYPGRKHDETIGFFTYHEYTFIVSGSGGEQLFMVLPEKRVFSYRDYVQPSLFMLEDDIPSWIFGCKSGRYSKIIDL